MPETRNTKLNRRAESAALWFADAYTSDQLEETHGRAGRVVRALLEAWLGDDELGTADIAALVATGTSIMATNCEISRVKPDPGPRRAWVQEWQTVAGWKE